MAEWLRRQTRNLMGNARAGSNPARCVDFVTQINYHITEELIQLQLYMICFWIVIFKNSGFTSGSGHHQI